MASPGKKSFLLRVDPALWAEVERMAADELRSTNAQVEYLLRDALHRRGRRGPGESARSAATRAAVPVGAAPAGTALPGAAPPGVGTPGAAGSVGTPPPTPGDTAPPPAGPRLPGAPG